MERRRNVGGTAKWRDVDGLSQRHFSEWRDLDRLSASNRLNILHADISIYSDLPDWVESGQTRTGRLRECATSISWAAEI